MKTPLSQSAFLALIDKYRDAPGIVAGIRAAHVEAGGELDRAGSVSDFFDTAFGVRK